MENARGRCGGHGGLGPLQVSLAKVEGDHLIALASAQLQENMPSLSRVLDGAVDGNRRGAGVLGGSGVGAPRMLRVVIVSDDRDFVQLVTADSVTLAADGGTLTADGILVGSGYNNILWEFMSYILP